MYFFQFFAEYYMSTHAMSAMMPNKKESGKQGRKRRKIEQKQQTKLPGSLNRFLVNTAESTLGSPAAPQELHEPDLVSVDIPVVALEAETALPEDASTSAQPNILPESFDLKVFTDIGYWPETVDETLKTELVKRGTVELQNKDTLFPKDSDGRSFSKDWFCMNLDNGETMLRTWLVFTSVNCAAYCFPCMFFQKAKGKSSFRKPSGFNAWRKLSPRLLEHEHSSYHLSAFTKWKEFKCSYRNKRLLMLLPSLHSRGHLINGRQS